MVAFHLRQGPESAADGSDTDRTHHRQRHPELFAGTRLPVVGRGPHRRSGQVVGGPHRSLPEASPDELAEHRTEVTSPPTRSAAIHSHTGSSKKAAPSRSPQLAATRRRSRPATAVTRGVLTRRRVGTAPPWRQRQDAPRLAQGVRVDARGHEGERHAVRRVRPHDLTGRAVVAERPRATRSVRCCGTLPARRRPRRSVRG